MEIWPNFFIVGASRAGTTSLYNFLKRTKGVFMSKVKEPDYFAIHKDSFYTYRNSPMTKQKYLELFKNVKDEKAIGEASTTYLVEPTAAKTIHSVLPNSKIIISLRNPVERAYSFYLLRRSGGKTYSFLEAITESIDKSKNYHKGIITNGGWYYEQVKRYLDVFGKNQVKVLFFEDFIKEPKRTVQEILEFLEVDSNPPESVELVHNILTQPKSKLAYSLLQNQKIRQMGRKLLSPDMGEIVVRKVLGKKIVKPKMSDKDRKFLEKLYIDDFRNLQKMLGIKLPWSIGN